MALLGRLAVAIAGGASRLVERAPRLRRLVCVRALALVGLSVAAGWVGPTLAFASPPTTAIRYVYDADGHLKAVVNPASETALYGWDPAGNLTSIALKATTKLSIIQLTPARGAVGETITIYGTGFSTTASSDTVKFNGTKATVSAATALALTVKVPTGATSGTVTVQTTTEGPVTSSQTFTVASSPAPKVTSLSATVASTGTEITISGSNFETTTYNDALGVNQTRTEVISASATSMKFKVPGATGSGHVALATPQGSVTGPTLFIPPNGIAPAKIGVTGELSLGSPVTVKVSKSAEDFALETFVGTAGQRVSLLASEMTYHGLLSIWGPEGKEVAGSQDGFWTNETQSLDGPVTLPSTGTYTILVEPGEGAPTGSVKLGAYLVNDVKGAITPTAEGAATAVSLTTPGQRAIYTIAGTAGEAVSLKTSSVAFSPEGGELEWLNPEGQYIVSRDFEKTGGEFFAQVKFATTGTYTLIVRPWKGSTGSMTLTAYNASDVTGTFTPSAQGDSKTITIGVPGQFARYTFSGSEGQRVSLLSSEATYHGWASIWGPGGSELSGSMVSFSSGESTNMGGPVTLPSTGTYTILVEPSEGTTGSVKLGAYLVTDVKGPITPTAEGAATAVSLTTPGQRAIYTIAGTAGEAVSLKTSSVAFSPEGGELEWLNPEGQYIESRNFEKTGGEFFAQVKFATTGNYTLIVRGSRRGSTGSMTLTAYNASDVTGTITPTAEGESKTVTIGVPGQHARYTFTGTEGQTVTLKARESTIANGLMSVWNPAGSKVSGSEANFSGAGASVEITLSETGTYTILLEPTEADTGTVKLTAYLGSHPGGFARLLASSPSASVVAQPASLAPSGSTLARPARSRSWRHVSRSSREGAPAHASPTSHARTERSSISPEMRGFRPRDPAAWQPPPSSHSGKAWESGEPPSPWTRVGRLQSLYGTTALSGQVLAQNGLPIAGVRVAIEDTYIAAQTDEAGRFLLSGGVPAGHHILVVEGESVAGHQRYGIYEVGVNLAANRTTILPYTIWLTPLDAAGDRHIDSPTTQERRLTTPQIPGLEVRLPKGTVITDPSGKTVTKLNITAIPVDRPPFPLPAFVSVPLYFTVQPGRAYLSKGAQIIYPNWDHLPPGQRVDFWNYEADSRGWYVYGQGTVTPDGKQVVPDPQVKIWEFTGAMVSGSPNPPGLGPAPGGSPTGGDPVDLHTGLFVYRKTDLVLPDTFPITIERTYRQSDSNSYSFGIGMTNAYDMRLWSNNNFHEADLILPDGGRVKYLRISPGEGYEAAEYRSTSAPDQYYGSTIKWDGPITGWDLTLTNGLTYQFPAFQPLSAIRDRHGNKLTIARESNGNITQITSPHGRWATFTYDGSNRITEIKDNGGRTLKYSYNTAGLLEKVTDPLGRTTKYEYNAAKQMTSVTDGRGKTYLATEYEASGRVSAQTLGDGGVYKFAYTVGGSEQVEATTVTDPRKLERKVAFNTEGFPTSETQALGTSLQQTTSYEPETGSGLPLSITDPRGRKTTFKYDSSGNMTQMTALAGTSSPQTTEYKYEPGTTELASVTDPLKHTTTYHYGEHGERLSETDPLGHKTSFEYDAIGELTAITNPLGKTTKLTYGFGDLTAVSDPLGHTTTQFVDALGRVASATTPGGQRTLYEYNLDGQVTKLTDPLGAVTSYEYDGDGDLVATTDPNKHTSSAAYDALDRLEGETDPLEHTIKGVYDRDGNLVELTDRRGKLSKFSYDSLNRLTEARFGVSGETSESTIAYEYDNGNRLTKITDSATGTYTPEYDELNRLKSLATPNGTVSYGYDEANRRTSMTAPGQEALKYTYDEANRLTELARGSQKLSFAYDEGSRPTRTTLVDGIEEKYGYDTANELTSIVYKKGTTTLGELDYGYTTNGGREAVWGSYARTGLPAAISAATYNANNEQTERSGKKLGYDANGNLTSDGTNEYKWNARNQLIEVSGGTTASFAYDPFGRRVSKTLAGATTKLLYDGANVVQETKGSATVNLITGLSADKTLARTTSSGTESFLTDALGSTIALAGSSGKAETNYTYDPFGNTSHEGATSENPFQYAGRENDGNGLYYNRARYYSPVAGRFISEDPLGQEAAGPNVYLYAEDSPTNAVDPYGTSLMAPMPGGAGKGPGGMTGPSGGSSSTGNAGAGAGFGPGVGGCSGPNKGTGGGAGAGGIAEELNCSLFEKLGEAAKEQGEEMSKHHCHNNQVVINHQCFAAPPGPPEYPPPEHPVEPDWPVIPIIPIPIPIPLPIPD